MIHDILDSWDEPEVKVPTAGDETTTTDTSDATDTTGTTNNTADSGDFDSVFGTDGDESDTDLFGSTTSAAGQAAKVSASDALNRIKGFDFSL